VADPSTFVPPASGVPPANPYAAPYTYVPPAASWSAPGGPVGYGPGTYQPGAYDPAAYAAPPVPPAVPSVDPDLAYYRRFPAGAIWLIVLGLFFLLGDSSLFHFFHGRFLGPMLLIGLAVWVFVSKMTKTGYGIENDGTAFYHWRLTRAVRSSFWLALTGVVWLLDELHILSWSRSWPIFVIGAGVMMIFRNTYSGYGYAPVPPMPSPPPPAAPVAGTAIVPAAPQSSISNDQEGR
jgi:hypothetical protein